MAKKQTGRPKMKVGVASDSDIRNIQIQLPAGPYDRGKEIAKANGLSMAAYVRQAILQRIRQDEEELEGSR
jgi:predicted DNA-binding protein